MLQILGFRAPGKANLLETLGPHCRDLVPTFRVGCVLKSTTPAFSRFSDLKAERLCVTHGHTPAQPCIQEASLLPSMRCGSCCSSCYIQSIWSHFGVILESFLSQFFRVPQKECGKRSSITFFRFRDAFGHFSVTFSDAFVTFFVTFLPDSFCGRPNEREELGP